MMTPHTITEQDFLKEYDRHANGIFRHCYAWMQDREQAKEVMCDMFRHLWLFLAAGNTVDSPKLFLYREATKELEERDRTGHVALTQTFLQSLPPDERSLCLFHFIDGLSYEEISGIAGGLPETYEEKIRILKSQFAFPLAHV